jgi:glycosyltransferase involved in cell wall biosynthesis
MRIGLIAPPWIPVPPAAYGGTEAVVDNLARGLAALGHSVALFTVGESTCPVFRLHRYQTAVEPMGNVAYELAHTLAAHEALAGVDVIHDHTLAGPLLGVAQTVGTPLVVPHHGPFTLDMRYIFGEAARRAAVVAISRDQARAAGGVPITAVIHHGIDTSMYFPGPGDGGYLLFLGRMCADKGVHHAVRVAHRAGRRLILVCKMREPEEFDYFHREVQPLLGPLDELIIEAGLPERLDLLRHAEALLNPICWPEPFGLVMAEALACGTPVLAFPNGAAPEIVEHGRTGYLCADEDAMLTALRGVPALDRDRCRAAAEHRFSVQRMARDHERLYRRLTTDVLDRLPRPVNGHGEAWRGYRSAQPHPDLIAGRQHVQPEPAAAADRGCLGMAAER